jgi:uncharacterized caspase-like protein
MASSIYYPCKRALIIGIDKYSGNIPTLTTCINDAKGLKEAFGSIGSNEYDRFNVTLKFNCKYEEFKQILDEFVNAIKKEDIILFYFAGHAIEFNENNYLIPSDYNYDHSVTEAEYRERHAINAQHILHRINSALPQVAVFILDCCRTKRTRSIGTNGLSPMRTLPGTLVVFSCGPGQGALDDPLNNENGVFAENLMKHIKASTEDIETIFMNVTHDVQTQTGGYQTPYRTSCLTKKVFFTKETSQSKISLDFQK